tara:strand:- start:277 stop:945 length:669 start_codon:yes stop_codon:yes gene_type:complete
VNNTISEIKYVVDIDMRFRIHNYLMKYATVPNLFSKAHLRTTYFDTEQLNSFMETVNGDYTKTKFRFREYINPDPNGAQYSVEIKHRKGKSTWKTKELIYKEFPGVRSIRTFRELISRINNNQNENLNHIISKLPDKVLYKTTTIKYLRNRYNDRRYDYRYNLDTMLTVESYQGNRFAFPSRKYYPKAIFEIKGKKIDNLPKFLEKLSLVPTSFSKFNWSLY